MYLILGYSILITMDIQLKSQNYICLENKIHPSLVCNTIIRNQKNIDQFPMERDINSQDILNSHKNTGIKKKYSEKQKFNMKIQKFILKLNTMRKE